MPRIVIINAYSRRNRGDGLLVDAAIDLVQSALPGRRPDITVVATDPASFMGDSRIRSLSAFGTSGTRVRGVRGILALLTTGRLGFCREFADSIRDADIVLSVGGGYLRGRGRLELIKATLSHVVQMQLVSRLGRPWIVLPQSIGPFPSPAWLLIRRMLGHASVVYVRDDASFVDLQQLPTLRRVPDCAILAMSTNGVDPRRPSGRSVGLVVRALREPRSYVREIGNLVEASRFEWIPALQSECGGNDDTQFTLQVTGSQSPLVGLDYAVENGAVDAVVSVRLHGALMSLMAGVPAVHLGYERKSMAAYADLGLHEFVVDARSFGADEVAKLVDRVLADGDSFWPRVDTALKAARSVREEVVQTIAAVLDRAATPDVGSASS